MLESNRYHILILHPSMVHLIFHPSTKIIAPCNTEIKANCHGSELSDACGVKVDLA